MGATVLVGWAGIGAFLGHRKKTDDWRDAPTQDWKPSAGDLTWQVSPKLSREGHGAGLRLRLTW